jgi:copper-containing nitrite reductase
MQRVTRRVGLTPSAIYRHFQSKDDVLKALLALIQARLLANVRAVCAETPDPLDRRRRLLQRQLQLIRENPAIPRIIFAEEVSSGHPERQATVSRIIRGFLERVEDLMRQGQQAGRIRLDVKPDTLALVFLGLIQLTAFLWHISGGALDVAAHADQARQVFSEAIAARWALQRFHNKSVFLARMRMEIHTKAPELEEEYIMPIATMHYRMWVVLLLLGMLGSGLGRPASPAPALVSLARDPADLPGPLMPRSPTTVRIDLEAVEIVGRLDEDTTYPYWTFNGHVPGPFIRVRVGDTIEVHLKNQPTNRMIHSVDFHAVTGPGGGAILTQTPPGEARVFTFKALNPGLYVYHCATPMVAHHITSGMYGLILVEPEGGLPPVNREFYVMQGELYTQRPFGQHGPQEFSLEKLLDERAEYLVFNGAVGALTQLYPMRVDVGETVRIFFGVGGPNYTSSFHIIGEIFDRVYQQAALTAPPLTDVQTTQVPAGGAAMVEFKVEVPGRYIPVDHALARLERGLVGFLLVQGPENLEVFHSGPAR